MIINDALGIVLCLLSSYRIKRLTEIDALYFYILVMKRYCKY